MSARSCSGCLDSFGRFARERLTAKQKELLQAAHEEDKTATRVVKLLSGRLGCSESALWNNVRSLRRAGLLESSKGDPMALTEAGRVVHDYLRCHDD